MFLSRSICNAVWYSQGIGPRAQAQQVINLTSLLTKHQNQMKNSKNVLNWTWTLRAATLTIFNILITNDKVRLAHTDVQRGSLYFGKDIGKTAAVVMMQHSNHLIGQELAKSLVCECGHSGHSGASAVCVPRMTGWGWRETLLMTQSHDV